MRDTLKYNWYNSLIIWKNKFKTFALTCNVIVGDAYALYDGSKSYIYIDIYIQKIII